MNNRATGMAFLALFTILLIAYHYFRLQASNEDLILLFALLFLSAGLVYLFRRDPPPHA